ncbi:MAG TPA: winged helix-turn-helix transcriptional regulator [Dehalococcoidia bacterium]|jgi:predicted ArsR family transcriptional regulator|nr:winged helix-turn-helix transcriptional regulator [Dehalococcoidia bacterium]
MMQETRQQILDHLRLTPEATVRELGDVLGLTPSGIRQHLMVLEQTGLVGTREERGKVGRPALVYSLTASGEATFPTDYDLLSTILLDEMREQAGSANFQNAIQRIATRMAEPHVEQLAGGSPEQRVEATCAILRSRSVVADWARDGDSFILNERTCPYPEVARKNSAACAIDTAYVQQLTGMDARLANCRVRGDEGCMYVLAPQSAATG